MQRRLAYRPPSHRPTASGASPSDTQPTWRKPRGGPRSGSTDSTIREKSVSSLQDLCLNLLVPQVQSFMHQLHLLPADLRNYVLLEALRQGLLTPPQIDRLIHPAVTELDFSHHRYSGLVNDYFLDRFLPHVPLLKDVDNWEDITSETFYQAPQGCPLLTTLSLSGCVNVSRSFIEDLLRRCKHLTSLDLSQLTLKTQLQDITISSPTLKHLKIHHKKYNLNTSRDPFRFALDTPNLRSLSIGIKYIKVTEVKQQMQFLEMIHFSQVTIDNENIFCLSTNDLYDMIRGSTCFVSLKLEGAMLNDLILVQMESWPCVELDLSNNLSLTLPYVVRFVRRCSPTLKVLVLRKSTVPMEQLLKACKEVEETQGKTIRVVF
jgi:hypothetical protein